MQNKNSVGAKLVAGVAGVTMALSMVMPLSAQTTMSTAELQAMIAQLQAQLSALQGGGTTTSTTFTMDLTIGSTGAEVVALQSFLESKGYLVMPVGVAKGYFGSLTQAAVSKYQMAKGITPTAGYFGPVTRAAVNAEAGTTTGGGTSGGSNGALSGGEASLEDLSASDGEEDEVAAGSSEQVAEFEFDVEDGDVEIQRVDLTFDSGAVDGDDDDEPWDVFETVTVYNADGDELASEDVSDEDDWLDDNGTNNQYVFRFSDLDYMVNEGDTGTLIVEVETNDGVELGTSNDSTWEIYIDTDGLRGVDGEGIQQEIGDENESVTFDVVEEGEGEELNVSSSSDDPESTTLQVEDDGRSDWFTVFAFELDAEEADIELDQVAVDFTSGTARVDNIINDAMLVIDGEEFDDWSWDGEGVGDTFASTTFDIDGDYVVEEGETVTVEVQVEFKALDGTNYSANETIAASVEGANVSGDATDDITATGSATGETHTLAVDGLQAEFISSEVDVDSDATPNLVEFSVTFELTAFGSDLYVTGTTTTEDTSLSAVAANTGFNYDLTATTSSAATIDSSADETALGGGTYFTIEEGQTEEFTLTVTGKSTTDVFSKLQLGAIQYGDSPANVHEFTLYLDENEFDTDSQLLSN